MKNLIAAVIAAAMAGCASFSPDGGFSQVADLTKERTGQAPVVQRTKADTASVTSRVGELLSQPLTADAAVEVAYLNNRGLQASFAEVGIAEADLVRAGRLRNPSFTFGRLLGGSGVEIDRALMFDVLGLLTMPLAREAERQRFEQAQMQAAYEAVGLASDVRRSYFNAVSARQLLTYYGQVKDAADASSDLAVRMTRAGNINKLDMMRERAFYAEATAQLARAGHQAIAEKERLSRLLGLSDGASLTLPERLPDLPDKPTEPQKAEQTAIDNRLDVLLAKRAVESTAKSLGLTRSTRLINVLDAGYQNKSETGHSRQNGYEIELELPLFDFGTARVARAEATYVQAVHRAAEVATQARSEARTAHSAYRTAFDVARHYRDEVVPLRKRISEENLLRYNGMLIGVFALLADAREQVTSVTAYVEALRDFWLAQTDLQTALTGRSPAATAMRPRAAAAASTAGH